MITRLSLTLVLMMFMTSSILADPPEFALVADIVRQQCLDCHNSQTSDGGLNLERFDSYASTIRDRVTWKRIFDAVESGQMPLRDSGYHLTAEQQESLLAYSTELQSQPDPELQAIDPGKPVIRRLTRLEYNNTVRDLFGLPYDIFVFPERLPIADKRYFIDQTVDGLGQTLHTSLSEYGQKVDVLLPHHGLPGDNRAEYGFANRGDALNFSPLLLEKYLELAYAIAHSDRLERDSPVMAALLGRSWQPTRNTDHRPVTNSSTTATVTPRYAANNNIGGDADGSEPSHVVFIDELAQAFQQGIGGTFDIPPAQSNQTVAGKGGLIRVGIGDAILSINPNIDLWLTAFATAQETSGEHLLANKVKGEKIFELTFKIEGDNDDVGVEQLAACVLARKGQSGVVTLTAVTSKDQEISHRAVIDPDKGNIFFAFRAPSGSSIRRLRVDGSQFSGDHILLDDLGFILHGVKGNRELPNNHTSSIEKPASHVRRDQTLAAFIEPTAPFDQRLRAFLTLAYRRSVTDAEAAQISAFVKAEIMQGKSEPDAIRLASKVHSLPLNFCSSANRIFRNCSLYDH